MSLASHAMNQTTNPHVFDATAARFEEEVIRRSMETPVLVDFWAEWCGPCKTLGPLLEKLAADYHGAFVLAKVDVDKEQELAAAFQIRSVPTVMLVKDGQLVDGFPGALPEGQLREFLTHHGIEPAGAPAEEEAAAEAAPLDPHQEVVRLRKAVEAEPDKDEHKLDLALALLQTGAAAEAEQLLDRAAGQPRHRRSRHQGARHGWASPPCSRTRRPRKCWKPRSPPTPATCAPATCWGCASWSPAMPRPGWNSSSRCCAATAGTATTWPASR